MTRFVHAGCDDTEKMLESQKFPLDWKSSNLRTSPNSNVRMFLKVISSFVR